MTSTVPSWSADEAAKLPYPLISATVSGSPLPATPSPEAVDARHDLVVSSRLATV